MVVGVDVGVDVSRVECGCGCIGVVAFFSLFVFCLYSVHLLLWTFVFSLFRVVSFLWLFC